MPTLKFVRDQEGRRYSLGDYLDSGATAVVYEATQVEPRDSHTPAKVAVKLALEAKQTEHFNDELRLLQDIRQISGGRFCVWASRGQAEDEPGRSALIMELIPKEWWIFRQQQNEEMSLALAEQYAELLVIIHERLCRTCGDRKSGDVYWNPISGQLIVLDWNVTKKRPDVPLTPQQQTRDSALVRADIHIFAYFWYQLIVGETPRDRIGVDDVPPRAPERWTRLTRGTRQILSRALDEQSPQRYETAAELLASIQSYRRWFDEPNPAKLIEEADRLHRDGPIANTCEMVANLAELALAKKPIPELRDRANELRQWATETRHATAHLIRSALAQARKDINDGYDQRAITNLDSAIANFKDRSAAESLQLQRWRTLANALEEGSRDGRSMRDFRLGLIAVLESMEHEQFDEARIALEMECAKPDLAQASVAQSHLQLLYDEIALRSTLQQAEALADQAITTSGEAKRASLEQANNSYQNALTALNILAQRSQAYHDALVETLPKLDMQIDAVKHQIEHDDLLRAADRNLAQVTQQVVALLEQALLAPEQARSWPEQLYGALSDIDEHKYPSFARLRQLDRLMKQQNYVVALDAITIMWKKDQQWPPTVPATKLCIYIAMQQVLGLAKEARWPDQVQEGVALYEAVSRLSSSQSQAQQSAGERLKEKAAWQKKYRAMFGEPPEPLHRLDDPNADTVLNQARQQGIELFERDPDEPDKWSIDHILAMRQRERLRLRLDMLDRGLNEVVERLGRRQEVVGDLLHVLIQIEQQVPTIQQTLDRYGLDDQHLNALVERVRRLENLHESLRGQKPNINALAQTIQELESQVAEWKNRYLQICDTIADIERQVPELSQRISEDVTKTLAFQVLAYLQDTPTEWGQLLEKQIDVILRKKKVVDQSLLTSILEEKLTEKEQLGRNNVEELLRQLDNLIRTCDRPDDLRLFGEKLMELQRKLHFMDTAQHVTLNQLADQHEHREVIVAAAKRLEYLTEQPEISIEQLKETLSEIDLVVNRLPQNLPNSYWEMLHHPLQQVYQRVKQAYHKLSSPANDREPLAWLSGLSNTIRNRMKRHNQPD